MAKRPHQSLAEDELLDNEKKSLNQVATWYTNKNWGFYTKIVWFTYRSIRPYFHGQKCLEMGPADGEMTQFISKDFTRLTVVDAAEEYVKKAVASASNIDGDVSLFETYSPKEKYDTIIMSHVLEHVENPLEILERASKWLSENGRIIIVVPNANSLHRQLGVKLGMLEHVTDLNDQDKEIGHRRVYNRYSLDKLMRESGLQTVSKGGIFLKLLANSQMESFKDDKLVEAMYELGKDHQEMCSEIYAVCMTKR